MKKLLLTFTLGLIIFLTPNLIKASYSCSDYGFMAYSDGLGHCKCMSGYLWGTDIFGHDTCVSGSSYCYKNYGYGSEYDLLSGKCKCSRGYTWDNSYSGSTCVSCSTKYGFGATSSLGGGCECLSGYIFQKDTFGDTKCVDLDDVCRDKIGYNSKYDSVSDSCVCNSGYEFSLKTGGGLECKRCSDKYGYHSSYSYLSKKCECDNGYTLDSEGQCSKKQNNVYFKLVELDTDNKKAIIKSDYDSSSYLVSYSLGCLSIKSYLNNRIVVNLGTDYSVDILDVIVLNNNNENCYITSRLKVDSSYSFNISEPITYINNDVSSNSCSSNQILRNGSCLSFTEDCRLSFGINVAGTKGKDNSSSCSCLSDYIWSSDGTTCVKGPQYVTSGTVLNLRKSPSTTAKVVGQLKKNTKYQITDLSNKDWVKIKYSSTIEGYVLKRLIKIK